MNSYYPEMEFVKKQNGCVIRPAKAARKTRILVAVPVAFVSLLMVITAVSAGIAGAPLRQIASFAVLAVVCCAIVLRNFSEDTIFIDQGAGTVLFELGMPFLKNRIVLEISRIKNVSLSNQRAKDRHSEFYVYSLDIIDTEDRAYRVLQSLNYGSALTEKAAALGGILGVPAEDRHDTDGSEIYRERMV
ncbi:hypothetical protein [Breznakiella homolactica]|uniref:Uncharacterized protein n=1 Tax=Breznakiella homolactica TaxID=2798577 RepID=A0A7T7XQ22_9SPIR|nr:hypothetical protein [Breznakiella homolactica]QQO10424.1 hypothetical protein JFL75_05760 [Breznakiella homolactica]